MINVKINDNYDIFIEDDEIWLSSTVSTNIFKDVSNKIVSLNIEDIIQEIDQDNLKKFVIGFILPEFYNNSIMYQYKREIMLFSEEKEKVITFNFYINANKDNKYSIPINVGDLKNYIKEHNI